MEYNCQIRKALKLLKIKRIKNEYLSWQQHPTRHQLYGHLPPITKTIQVRRTRHAGHCWRSRHELKRDVLLWIPTHGRAKAGRPARTYIQQLCEDTGCCPEDLPRAMNDREEWRERVRDIRAASTIWWWWWSKKNEKTSQNQVCRRNLIYWIKKLGRSPSGDTREHFLIRIRKQLRLMDQRIKALTTTHKALPEKGLRQTIFVKIRRARTHHHLEVCEDV